MRDHNNKDAPLRDLSIPSALKNQDLEARCEAIKAHPPGSIGGRIQKLPGEGEKVSLHK